MTNSTLQRLAKANSVHRHQRITGKRVALRLPAEVLGEWGWEPAPVTAPGGPPLSRPRTKGRRVRAGRG